MQGQFKHELTLPAGGGVINVIGPFKVDNEEGIDKDIKRAVVHFLIVQGEGSDTVIGEGQGEWKRGDDDWTGDLRPQDCKHPNGTPGQFSTEVDHGIARGIGLAVAIKAGRVREDGEFDPPSFQTLTWCANFKFVKQQAEKEQAPADAEPAMA
jgi:hypothetical protein